jgi:threonine/homoserine/homoserine lactone efflux protein
MQLLSALDQIAESLYLAICVAVILFAVGMIVHATILLAKRLRARSSKRAKIREWTCQVSNALLLFFGL